MKPKSRPLAASVAASSIILAAQASAAVLLSAPGPTQVSGGGDGVSLVDTTNDTNDWITAGGYDTGTATVPLYMQFTMRVDDNNGETGIGGFFTGFQLHHPGISGEELAVGNNWNSVNWGGFQGPADYDLTGSPPYVVGEAATFVLKLDQAADTATVWFNPDTSLTEAAQPASITTVLPGIGENDQFTAIRLRAGNNTGATTFSDITIQDTTVFATESSTFPLIITPSALTPGNYDFEWESQDGKLYDLVSSTDLSTPITTWLVWDGREDIEGTAPTNMLADIPGGGDPKRFFAVVEEDPPPLLAEGFESDDGGFTSSVTTGTGWTRGTPDSSGPGGVVTQGNGGSANSWATNLGTSDNGSGDPGFYADPTTDSCLRSPDIDLTEVSGAALIFAEALDLADGDLAQVKLINAAGDVEIATVYTADDSDIVAADWASANGGAPIDLSAGAGLTVYLQWCLSGTGGSTKDFLGWYIDDVVVTETAP